MNGGGGKKKFGGGRVPTGTPSLAWSSVVVVASLLAGASIVHNIYKPDMTLPPVEVADGNGAGATAGGKRKES
ncbi:hypothetical protein CFC21_050711 [Triticum aestivum]|uniref:Uncharacterized protein n=4 Tax=Triticinae TaxID=1648030 RepID=A0A452XC22_AEGTS|nr:uncharacterized protein LOC109780301 [Aegilops tauschii subsp. strangulata]KAF7040837.1 hypothetical protein CFC21_050711 [Triticum aestivum]